MRVVGIIAEFNPFHKGHKYLVDQVKHRLEPDAIIAVMSGNLSNAVNRRCGING